MIGSSRYLLPDLFMKLLKLMKNHLNVYIYYLSLKKCGFDEGVEQTLTGERRCEPEEVSNRAVPETCITNSTKAEK